MGKSETKAIKDSLAKLTALDSSAAVLQKAKETLEWLAEKSPDHRVRAHAARELREMAWKIYEHHNPAVQKHEVDHKNLPKIPSTLTVKIARDK